jgi:hypothetical protein
MGHEYTQDKSVMVEAICDQAQTLLDNTHQEAWLKWANPSNLMPQTQETVAQHQEQL